MLYDMIGSKCTRFKLALKKNKKTKIHLDSSPLLNAKIRQMPGASGHTASIVGFLSCHEYCALGHLVLQSHLRNPLFSINLQHGILSSPDLIWYLPMGFFWKKKKNTKKQEKIKKGKRRRRKKKTKKNKQTNKTTST